MKYPALLLFPLLLASVQPVSAQQRTAYPDPNISVPLPEIDIKIIEKPTGGISSDAGVLNQPLTQLINSIKNFKLPLSFCNIKREVYGPPGSMRSCRVADSRFKQAIFTALDTYKFAAEMRDKAIRKAKQLQEQIDRAIEMRESWERRAFGELAGLGKNLPDYTRVTDECARKFGETSCAFMNLSNAKIDDMVRFGFNTISSEIFKQKSEVRRELDRFTSSSFGALSRHLTQVDSLNFANSMRYRHELAENAVDLENYSKERVELIDSIYASENLSDMVSSGRSAQVSAQVAALEAEVELDIARSKIRHLHTFTTHTADIVTDWRARAQATYKTGAW